VRKKVIRRVGAVEVECYKCGEMGHKCRECLLWKKVKEEKKLKRVEEDEVARVAKPQEAQQEKWKSSVEELRRRAEEHCGRSVPKEAHLLELGWYTEKVIVSYLTYKGCRSKGCHVEDNRGQGVISFKRWKVVSWCGCKKRREEKTAWSREAEA